MPDIRRQEFQKVKTKILKTLGRKTLICARCGHRSKSTHIHHIKPIIEGGTDNHENLIPLCGDCHLEWDSYENAEIDFGCFLTTLNAYIMAALYKHSMFRVPSCVGTGMKGAYAVQFSGNAIKAYKEDGNSAYWGQIQEENEIFNAYPYSDTHKMLELYGEHYNPISQSEINEVIGVAPNDNTRR